MPKIGVLALQGAFREHLAMLGSLGAETVEIRQRKHLDGLEGVIIPGGESTTIGKLLLELEIMDPLREMIARGMPVFGTCAGLILLCRDIEDSAQPRLGVLDAAARRNAFGRQVDSFEAMLPYPGIGPKPFPAVFIRAPVITRTGPEVERLVEIVQNGAKLPVAIRQGNVLAASFHPELTNDSRIHASFLNMVRERLKAD